MASVLTSSSALTALQNLSATQSALAAAQQQIATGLSVSTASDNAAYWSIASTMKAQASGVAAVSDALNVGAAVVSVAAHAVNLVLSVLSRIKGDLVTADQRGASLADVQSDILAQQKTLISIVTSASFGGVNLLDGSQGSTASFIVSPSAGSGTAGPQTLAINTHGLAGSYSPAGSTAFTNATPGVQLLGTSGFLTHQFTNIGLGNTLSGSVAGRQVNANGAILYNSSSVLSFNVTNATPKELALIQTGVDTLIGQITTAGAELGTASSVIAQQQNYVAALSDAIASGVGSLVDADMNVASTRLQALQTQQRLGTQALSIANQDSRLILKLFAAG